MDPLLKKLQFKNNDRMLVLDLPQDLRELKDLWESETTVLSEPDGKFKFALCFVQDQQAIKSALHRVSGHLEDDALLWMAYPKKSSKKYNSDITRDQGWEPLGAVGLEPVRQVAIDADWSALRFRPFEHIKSFTRGFALSEKGKQKIEENK